MRFRLFFSLFFSLLPATVMACPFCADTIQQNSLGLSKGIFWSLLFMLGVFYSVTAFVIYMIVHGGKNKQVPALGQTDSATPPTKTL